MPQAYESRRDAGFSSTGLTGLTGLPLAQTAELGMAIQVSCLFVGFWCPARRKVRSTTAGRCRRTGNLFTRPTARPRRAPSKTVFRRSRLWCSGAERHLQGIAKKVLHISTCLFDAAAPASIRHFAVFCAWPKSKKGGYVSLSTQFPLCRGTCNARRAHQRSRSD